MRLGDAVANRVGPSCYLKVGVISNLLFGRGREVVHVLRYGGCPPLSLRAGDVPLERVVRPCTPFKTVF